MATYGKRRHILPVLSAPRGSTEGVSSKRHRRRIQGSRADSASTTYCNEMSGPASLHRRDSVDEMADILLDDTAMEERRVNHAMEMYSSDRVPTSDNHAPKPSSHLRGDCTSMVTHGSSQRKLPNIKSIEEAKTDDGRLEGFSPMNSTKAGGFSPAYHGFLQNKPLTHNIASTNGNLDVMTRTTEGMKPDGAGSLAPESYQLQNNHQFKSNTNLSEEAKIHNRQFTPNTNPYEEAKIDNRQFTPTTNLYEETDIDNGNLYEEAKTDNRRVHGSKPTNYTENGGSFLASNGFLQAKPSPFNPVDINSKIEAMLAATRDLKPDAPGSLRPGSYSPFKTSRPKDGNVLTKMKTAMNHIHSRANKKSPEPAETPDIEEVMSQPALPTMELRMNEGGNLNNPKIASLTGHGKIRRKPLADDGKLLRSQNSSSYQLAQSMSEPTLELSSDMPGNSVDHSEADNTTEPFPLYDTNFDIPFSTSPFAQSTPRIRVQSRLEDGSDNEDYSDMILDIKGSEMPGPVQRDVLKSKGRPSARSGQGRMKKHPSPCKAELEKWENIMRHFPDIDDSESQSGGVHDSPVNVYLHPTSSVLGPKSTNAKLPELTRKQDTGKGAGTLGVQGPGVLNTSTVVEDAPNRNRGRKSFVSKQKSSKTRSRERTRSGRPQPSGAVKNSPGSVKDDNRMDTDELQWEMTPLLKKAT